MVYLDAGRLDEAVGPLALAVERDGRSPVFLNNLGSTLERLGDLAGARNAYSRALEADSSYAKAAASLQRVEPLVPAGAEPVIDLPARVDAFLLSLRTWQAPDSVTGPEGEEGHLEEGC